MRVDRVFSHFFRCHVFNLLDKSVYHSANTLPELCSRLKNFGIGRMFVRTAHDQDKGDT